MTREELAAAELALREAQDRESRRAPGELDALDLLDRELAGIKSLLAAGEGAQLEARFKDEMTQMSRVGWA